MIEVDDLEGKAMNGEAFRRNILLLEDEEKETPHHYFLPHSP